MQRTKNNKVAKNRRLGLFGSIVAREATLLPPRAVPAELGLSARASSVIRMRLAQARMAASALVVTHLPIAPRASHESPRVAFIILFIIILQACAVPSLYDAIARPSACRRRLRGSLWPHSSSRINAFIDSSCGAVLNFTPSLGCLKLSVQLSSKVVWQNAAPAIKPYFVFNAD